jgi:hypothetical protein
MVSKGFSENQLVFIIPSHQILVLKVKSKCFPKSNVWQTVESATA